MRREYLPGHLRVRVTVLAKDHHLGIGPSHPERLPGVGRHVHLLQLVLVLNSLLLLLLDVPVRRLPHEEVLDDVPHRLPWQEVLLDLIEVLAVLLDGLLEQVGLRTAPVLQLVPEDSGNRFFLYCTRVLSSHLQRTGPEVGTRLARASSIL